MADIEFEDGDPNENPMLKETVEPENELKTMLVKYVGSSHNPEDGDVTVEMIVETLAEEFPEFLMVVAEENFIRGYRQALVDIDTTDVNAG